MWLPWLAACVAIVTEGEAPPACDGALQELEGDRADAPYDRDGDGYYDAADAGCAAAYGANRLDCDDGDIRVSPASSETPCNGVDDDCNPDTPDEVDADEDGTPACLDCNDHAPELSPENDEDCWDLIDNDCNGLVDEECGVKYAGVFQLDRNLAYNCLATSIRIGFDEINLYQFDAETATVSVSGGGSTPSGGLDGGVRGDGEFWFQTVEAYAGCDQTYTLSGRFDDLDHFTGEFRVDFQGGLCLGCRDQLWSDLIGTRIGEL